MTPRPPLDELLSLLGATLAAEGITTEAGAGTGDSFIDASLAGAGDNSFVSMLAILYPSQRLLVDSKDITAFDDATGKVTLAGAYKGVGAAIPAGVPYKIVTFRFVPAEVAALVVLVNAIEAKLDHAGHGLAALAAALAEILEDTGTDLEAKLDALYPYHGLVYYGKVTTYTNPTHFKASGLVGFGNDYFNDHRVYVVRDAAGAGDNPQGEMQPISDYVSSDGTFTHTAFTVPLTADDDVLILHPAIASLINTTYGLAALKDLIDAVEAKVDKTLFSMDFWSDPVEEIPVGDGVAGTTEALGTVTIEDLPTNATIVRAIAMFKFRMIENINAGANKLNGATDPGTSQVIQVADDTPGTYYDAINFVDDQFGIAAETREGGDVLIGSIDISGAGKVDGNDGYLFRWLLARADLDFLNFQDVQCGLRIWYSI